MLRKFYTLFLEILFPRRCLGCGEFGYWLCPVCREKIPTAEKPENDDDEAVFAYHEPIIKQAVWHLKYRGNFNISQELGQLLFEYYLDYLAEKLALDQQSGSILVIPIPLTHQRARERGYNQAELLARHFTLADQDNFQLMADGLKKTRDTKSQMTIKNRSQRRKNIAKSFTVPEPDLVKGRIVLVIDDVLTTGGTIAEARRALEAAGARKVYGLALAHG